MIKLETSSDGSTYYNIGNTTIVLGSFTSQGGHSGTNEAVTVTFPVTFKTAPMVFCIARSIAPYTKARNITISNRTTTSFVANVLKTDRSAQGMDYFAIGEKSR